jgi:hypothetical protein
MVGYLRGHGVACETAIAILELWDAANREPLGKDEVRRHVVGMYGRYAEPSRFFTLPSATGRTLRARAVRHA